MIITLIGVIILMIGIAMSPIRKIIYEKTKGYWLDDNLGTFQMVAIIIGALWSFVCALLILFTYTACNTEMKIDLEEQRTAIEASLKDKNFEGEADINVRNLIYDDIKEYNSKVRKGKHLRDSDWTSWLTCPCFEDFEIIEYEEVEQ